MMSDFYGKVMGAVGLPLGVKTVSITNLSLLRRMQAEAERLREGTCGGREE